LEPDFPVPYLSWSEIFDSLSSHSFLVLGPGFIDEEEYQGSSQGLRPDFLSKRFSAGPRFAGHLKQLMEHINQLVSSGRKVVIVSRQIARLKELWDEQSVQTNQNQPAFLEGSLTEGFDFETPDCSQLHLLSDGEIFGWRRPEPRKRVRLISEAPEAGYADLEIDGYVVQSVASAGSKNCPRALKELKRVFMRRVCG
jgi:transcription-repair coupling factor (superfamily II helicase)